MLWEQIENLICYPKGYPKKKKKVVGKYSSRAAFAAEHFFSQSLEKGIMISVAFIKVCDKNQ